MSADLDKAIDRAVREMLDVEPPAGLRGRVMERLESPRRRGAWWIWMAGPVVTAAAILLAVSLWPRHEPQVQMSAYGTGRGLPPSQAAPGSTPPAVAPTVYPPVPPGPPEHPRAAAAPREQQPVKAADVADESPAADFPRIPALTIPELSVPQIRGVAAASAPAQIGVDPIATPAPIDVEPLTLSPRERHDQE